jgi:hypothetical protein
VGIDLESLKAKIFAVNTILLQWFSYSVSHRSGAKRDFCRDEPESLQEAKSCQSPGISHTAQCKSCEKLSRISNMELLDTFLADGESSVCERGGDETAIENDILCLIDGLKEGVTSVDYSCTFMKSAINRSLDFTKATKNIALSPSVSPFDIRKTLTWPLKVQTSYRYPSLSIRILTQCDSVYTFVYHCNFFSKRSFTNPSSLSRYYSLFLCSA